MERRTRVHSLYISTGFRGLSDCSPYLRHDLSPIRPRRLDPTRRRCSRVRAGVLGQLDVLRHRRAARPMDRDVHRVGRWGWLEADGGRDKELARLLIRPML